KYEITAENVAYIGDDVNDLPILKRVGFSLAVANGVKKVKEAADYVTEKAGGQGAVREALELILAAQGEL
ncbi:MAG: HAD hydrolase family protein, partial [Bacillota bacterium]